MAYKSHTKEEARAAQKAGETLYYLNTSSGEDDILIGAYEECLADVLSYHDLDELPESWELILVDWSI